MNNNDGNEKRDINLNSGNYNQHVEGDNIQGDSIKQQGPFGVGVNQGTVNYNLPPEKPYFYFLKYFSPFLMDLCY